MWTAFGQGPTSSPNCVTILPGMALLGSHPSEELWAGEHCNRASWGPEGMYTPICGCCLVTESCLTLCDSMDCSLPGSSVCGISQARILECVASPMEALPTQTSHPSTDPRPCKRPLWVPPSLLQLTETLQRQGQS